MREPGWRVVAINGDARVRDPTRQALRRPGWRAHLSLRHPDVRLVGAAGDEEMTAVGAQRDVPNDVGSRGEDFAWRLGREVEGASGSSRRGYASRLGADPLRKKRAVVREDLVGPPAWRS